MRTDRRLMIGPGIACQASQIARRDQRSAEHHRDMVGSAEIRIAETGRSDPFTLSANPLVSCLGSPAEARCTGKVVGEAGLEPAKAKPADLQSAPFAARDIPPAPDVGQSPERFSLS